MNHPICKHLLNVLFDLFPFEFVETGAELRDCELLHAMRETMSVHCFQRFDDLAICRLVKVFEFGNEIIYKAAFMFQHGHFSDFLSLFLQCFHLAEPLDKFYSDSFGHFEVWKIRRVIWRQVSPFETQCAKAEPLLASNKFPSTSVIKGQLSGVEVDMVVGKVTSFSGLFLPSH